MNMPSRLKLKLSSDFFCYDTFAFIFQRTEAVVLRKFYWLVYACVCELFKFWGQKVSANTYSDWSTICCRRPSTLY